MTMEGTMSCIQILPCKVENHQEISSPIVGDGEYAELKPSAKKALLQLRCNVEDAILGNYILGRKKAQGNMQECELNEEDCKAREDINEISLWGIPLLPSKGHEGTNLILLKLLQAKDYKVPEAFEMLQKMLKWRMDFRTDGILNEEFGPEFADMAFFDGTDREGHPLCYMVYGLFSNSGSYVKTFGTEERCQEFLRWRVQVMERGIQKLCLKAGGSDSLLQIIDLKNAPGPATRDLRATGKKALLLIHDNYPEFVVKTVFVNVPLWYYAYHTVCSRFLTQRAKNKFVFVRPSRVPRTLHKFIEPEVLPVQYGGFKRENDDEFTPEDKVKELTVKGGDTQNIKIPVSEPGVTVVWDVLVIGLDVTYMEEFVPEDEGSYRILLQKDKKMATTVRNSFYINEPGMILLSIENGHFKKKKILYRVKLKPTVPVYIYMKK